MKKFITRNSLLMAALSLSCFLSAQNPTSVKPGKVSRTTNLKYNDWEGGFVVREHKGPSDKSLFSFKNTIKATEYGIPIGDNLYIDQTEVSNVDYLEYLYFIYMDSAEIFYVNAWPDTTVWNDDTDLGRYYMNNYLRHPAYRFFPVVGVDEQQAANFCKWRSELKNILYWKSSDEYKYTWDAESEIPEVESVFQVRLPTEDEWYQAAKLGGYQDQGYFSKRTTIGKKSGAYIKEVLRSPLELTTIEAYTKSYNSLKEIQLALNLKGLSFGEIGIDQPLYVYSSMPNKIGIYNLVGNVAEIVTTSDEWEYGITGGSFKDEFSEDLVRFTDTGWDPSNAVGFRCVCEVLTIE